MELKSFCKSNLGPVLSSRTRAAAIHLMLSAVVASFASALVFCLWFPSVYRHMAGGQELFVLLASVDLVMGPLLTFIVFDTRKGRAHLRRDLTVIVILQMSALAYGLVAVFHARPVALVFEKDRFRVITAAQVHLIELNRAGSAFQRLSLTGPVLLGSREPTDAEQNEVLSMSLEGIDRAQRPVFWQTYEESIERVLGRSRPLTLLLERYPKRRDEISAVLAQHHLSESEATFLPLIVRKGDWVAVLDARGKPVDFIPADGFF